MIFLANIEYSETEGISKKVQFQAKAISELRDRCRLICKKNNSTYIIDYKNGVQVSDKVTENNIIDEAIILLQHIKEKGIYIRHMIPSVKLLTLLRIARKEDNKIYYEIPTYPYYGEQLKASKNKFKTICRLMIDTIFWPSIYRNIDKLVTIRSSSKARTFNKMIEINNGIDSSKIEGKIYNENNKENKFKLVGVGTIYKYHGYDRVIEAISRCNGKVDDKKVEFHIIGASDEIENLKEKVKNLSLEKNVLFYGKRNFEELNNICNDMDLGVGCVALFRRNADIDTTLKVIEYLSRGIPVLTSGKMPKINRIKIPYIEVSNSEENLNIKEIYNEFKKFNLEDLKNLSSISKKYFDWKNIFSYVLSQ